MEGLKRQDRQREIDEGRQKPRAARSLGSRKLEHEPSGRKLQQQVREYDAAWTEWRAQRKIRHNHQR